MKILFIGDIFGRSGRKTVKSLLPGLIEKHKPDLVLANPENLSHGNGFSKKTIVEMQEAGVDFFTSGNHVFDNKDGANCLGDQDFPVLRPANYPDENTPGDGYRIIESRNGKKVLVISLIGRVFMGGYFGCPFRYADKILDEADLTDVSAVFVDFHAEATSEKYALAYYLDGRVSALVGTHTHVQTNDARILEQGTAYITDVGMTGPFDSVIGVKKDIIIKRFLTQLGVKHEPEMDGQMVLSAFLVEVDSKTRKAKEAKNILEFS
jgi:2',3'-cyclic-nucleotide 2'-phosphodiesterase